MTKVRVGVLRCVVWRCGCGAVRTVRRDVRAATEAPIRCAWVCRGAVFCSVRDPVVVQYGQEPRRALQQPGSKELRHVRRPGQVRVGASWCVVTTKLWAARQRLMKGPARPLADAAGPLHAWVPTMERRCG